MADKKKVTYQVDPEIESVSKQLLKSLIDEFKSTRHPFTHIGTIEAVREADGYEETQERLLVIRYNDGYVYMLEREAGDDYSKMTNDELLGKEIPFKVMQVSSNAIWASRLHIQDIYQLAFQNNETLRGTIESSNYDKTSMAKSYFAIRCYGDTVIMNLADFSVYGVPKFLPVFYGQKIAFKVVGIDENGRIHVSKAKIEEEQRNAVLKEIKDTSVLATILKVSDYGAILEYKGVRLVLRDKDFSIDYTPVNMVKRKGDAMMIKLLKVSQAGKIFVEPTVKYKTPATASLGKYRRGETTEGTVTGLTTSGIYVRVDDGIDVLCPVPESFEPLKGDVVRVKILQIYKRKLHDTEVTSLKGVIVGRGPRK